jgi:hypothetical protein
MWRLAAQLSLSRFTVMTAKAEGNYHVPGSGTGCPNTRVSSPHLLAPLLVCRVTLGGCTLCVEDVVYCPVRYQLGAETCPLVSHVDKGTHFPMI